MYIRAVYMYKLSRYVKNVSLALYLYQILTNFQNYFTVRSKGVQKNGANFLGPPCIAVTCHCMCILYCISHTLRDESGF